MSLIPILGAAQTGDIAVFAVAAVLVLTGAFGVVLFRNPVHSALSLVQTLFGVAVLFVAQQAHFLAAVQVIVYAGAIVVVFLFVIMLLGVDKSEPMRREPLRLQRIFAVLASLTTTALIVVLARGSWDATGASSQGGAASGPGSNVEKLADSIFTQYLLPFEATSLLLVIAVVGAVVLARRPPSVEIAQAHGNTSIGPDDAHDNAYGQVDAAAPGQGEQPVSYADPAQAPVEGGSSDTTGDEMHIDPHEKTTKGGRGEAAPADMKDPAADEPGTIDDPKEGKS